MKLPRAVAGSASVNMTPMIDVVFQLIVFFTATSTIAKSEFAQKLELPVAEQGKDQDEASRKKRISANIVSSGELFVSGRAVSAAEFREILGVERGLHGAAEIEVQFRADREAHYSVVEPYLLACARSGIWQVSFAVQPPKPSRGN